MGRYIVDSNDTSKLGPIVMFERRLTTIKKLLIYRFISWMWNLKSLSMYYIPIETKSS